MGYAESGSALAVSSQHWISELLVNRALLNPVVVRMSAFQLKPATLKGTVKPRWRGEPESF